MRSPIGWNGRLVAMPSVGVLVIGIVPPIRGMVGMPPPVNDNSRRWLRLVL